MITANFVAHAPHHERVGQLQYALLMQLGKMNDPPLRPRMALGHDKGKFVVAEALVA